MSPTVVITISCKHSCVSAGDHAHAPSGRGIWEELKLNCDAHAQAAMCSFCHILCLTLLLLLSHNLDSNQWTGCQIHRRFAVRSCDLRPFYSCCHALNKFDIKKASGPFVASSLHSEHYSPRPFGLLNPVHSMASESNFTVAYTSILSPITNSWPANGCVLCKTQRNSTIFNSWRKPTTDFNQSLLRLAPQCVASSSSWILNCAEADGDLSLYYFR